MMQNRGSIEMKEAADRIQMAQQEVHAEMDMVAMMKQQFAESRKNIQMEMQQAEMHMARKYHDGVQAGSAQVSR